jgi:hypothetical protein
MTPEYVYITETHIGNGEYSVAGRLADGTLCFGFRTFDYWGKREKARDYAGKRLPVFGKPVASA